MDLYHRERTPCLLCIFHVIETRMIPLLTCTRAGCADELGGELIIAVATEPDRKVLIFVGILFEYTCMTFCGRRERCND